MVALNRALKVQPGAKEELTLLYQQNKWLEIHEKPSTDELITLAAARIQQDSKQYEPFLTMLRGITGLGFIADKITGYKSSY